MSELTFITPDWEAPSNVRACATTRAGGVSKDAWEGLNLGLHVLDDSQSVLKNRELLMDALVLPQSPVWLEQVHGNTVIDASSVDTNEIPVADASFTTTAGEVCAVMTADCLPVLFTNINGDCVAAAHAGWRGLHGGVLEATVNSMPDELNNILAWMGPAIGSAAFEVGEEVKDAFAKKLGDVSEAFVPSVNALGEPRYLADIYKLATLTLNRSGVTRVSGGGLCTYSDEKRFYSYRRDGVTGRMASLIWLE